jgi:hypothetical protein
MLAGPAGLIETYFVAKLGTDALAGMALVFPVLMPMQMMSGGAVGGGISSAIARALGARRRRRRCAGGARARHRGWVRTVSSRSLSWAAADGCTARWEGAARPHRRADLFDGGLLGAILI